MATVYSFPHGDPLEELGSHVQAKRVGPFVFVAGTAAIEPSGQVYAPGDTYEQTLYIFERISQALRVVGAELRHITRTRAFLANIRDGAEYVYAHGVVFKGILPATTAVGAELPLPGVMVQVEVDAVILEPGQEYSR